MIYPAQIFALLVLSSPILFVAGHSWIACTDYAEMSGLYYTHDKCRGWPRSGNQYAPRSQPFGYESGYAFVPRPGSPCRTMRNDVCGYNAEQPMAKYYVGQTFVIAHPAKNHCNDPQCGASHNQDNGNFVYAYQTSKDATSDLPLEQFMNRSNMIADLGISPVDGRSGYTYSDFVTYPKIGFQNAPAYCKGPDSALATNNVTIPNSWAPGRYTFMWLWFMGSKEVTSSYSSCWEADVYASKAEADQARQLDTAGARQDVAVTYNSNWGSGADGSIDMPADINNTYVVVKFPTKVGSFSVWGANVNATAEQVSRGEYILHQRNMWWTPSSAGFTVSFSQESYLMPCGISAKQIETRVVQKTRRKRRFNYEMSEFGGMGPQFNIW